MMHISEYRKIAEEQIDLLILDRISEDEVQQWLAAWLHKHCSRIEAMRHVSLDCWHREFGPAVEGKRPSYYDVSCSLHGAGECALTHETLHSATEHLAELLAGNPSEKAAEKKRQARALLADAEKLEAASASAKRQAETEGK